MTSATAGLGLWDELAEALRSELAEYGGLLALLDEQRDAIMTRQVDRLLEINAAVESQTHTAARQLQRREQLGSDLAFHFGGRPDLSLRDLFPFMPACSRGLFEALLEGGRDVLDKAKSKGRRNRVLLSRASDVNEEILRRLQPRSMTKTYTARGAVALRSGISGSLDVSA